MRPGLSANGQRLGMKGRHSEVYVKLAQWASVTILSLKANNWKTGFYTPPPLEGKIAKDSFTPSPPPVMYKISGPRTLACTQNK